MAEQNTQIHSDSTENNPDSRFKKDIAINKKAVVSYFLLPGIIPEIRNLARINFGYLAYLMAIIYQMVRILPDTHPYTKPQNIGKFSIRQVIATAANNITLNKQNIDQIIVFIAILAGIVLIIFQVIAFFMFLFVSNAWAGPGVPGDAASLFITPYPQTDIAFYMLREVFGIPDFFGALAAGQPNGLHQGLHLLIEFYNFAILFVAVLVFLYYVIVVVSETAESGVPFGKRFSHIYAPFRLVIAVGLLVPLNYGFNGSQYIALYAAKLGSSFATQGWTRYMRDIGNTNPLGVENATLLAQPNTPDISGLVESVATVKACQEAYFLRENIMVVPYFVDNANNPVEVDVGSYYAMRDEARASGKKGRVTVYFGEDLERTDITYPGRRIPYCGEISFPIQVPDLVSYNATGAASPDFIQFAYFVMYLVIYGYPELDALARRIALLHNNGDPCTVGGLPGDCATSVLPDPNFKTEIINRANEGFRAYVDSVFENARGQINYNINPAILQTGWGGAGIWYSSIAEVNGAFTSALFNQPSVTKYPLETERALKEKEKRDSMFNECERTNPNIAKEKSANLYKADKSLFYTATVNSSHQYWRCDTGRTAANFLLDSFSAIFGLNGLLNIRQTYATAGTGGENIRNTVHPLAKLSSVGKSLVDSAIQNMGMAMFSSFAGGMMNALSPHIGKGLQAASEMFVSIATIGLSIGFILYYILPFLPFLYFFFAVGGWVKAIFESMVGAPLWALAHLRIDGEGLPGKSAMNGYFLIFEIFLRPILTVFGLIGGMAIFTAMATILDTVFDLAVRNVTGNDPLAGAGANPVDAAAAAGFNRHIVDEFFFTIVYAIILYMMGTSAFKMIHLVPNNILRWMGNSVSAFSDGAQDPGGGLTQYAAVGGAKVGGELGKGATKLSEAVGTLGGSAFGLGSRGGQP